MLRGGKNLLRIVEPRQDGEKRQTELTEFSRISILLILPILSCQSCLKFVEEVDQVGLVLVDDHDFFSEGFIRGEKGGEAVLFG